MNDQQTTAEGSADAGTPDAVAGASDTSTANGSAPAGTPVEGTALGSGEEGSAPENTTELGDKGDDGGFDWASASLDADTAEWVEGKGYKAPADIIAAYRSLESKLGEKVPQRPDPETGTQEDWDAWHSHIGRPEKPEEYKFSMPEGVPENIPYDNVYADSFRQAAHEAGISGESANKLHGWFVQNMADGVMNQTNEVVQNASNAHNELIRDWGTEDSEEYRGNVAAADRALTALGLDEAFKQAGLIHESGTVTNAKVAKALATVGKGMFAEETYFTGDSGAQMGITNPFADGTENMTDASRLVANDPERAKQLIRAAGKKPTEFGL